MKKQVIYRSLPMILSLVTLFTVCFTPAAAASDMGLYSVDLLDTGSITWGTEKDNYSNNYNGYGLYTGNNIYFNWTPPVQSIKLQYIYITVYSSVSPRSPVLYSDGVAISNGTLVGTYNSYYQYSFNIGTSIGELTYCQRYGGSDRYFSLVSAQGYSNIYEPVTKFNFYAFEEYLTGGGDMDRVQFVESYGLNPPYSYEHLYPGREIAFDYYYIDIPTDAYSLNTYSQLTFIYDYVGAGVSPTVSLYNPLGQEPAIVIDSEYIQTFTFSTHISGSNNVEFTPVTTQITVDLSEFDLSNYTIDISLCIQPDDVDSRTKQVTWINVRAIYLDQLVHEPTWYETFFSWIQKTLGINTDKIIDKLDALFSDSSDGAVADQKQEIQDNAESFNSSMEIIAGIEEPDVDLDDMFSHIPTFSPVSTTILTTIINIPEVLQITIISFVFMFAAIVLFGLR